MTQGSDSGPHGPLVFLCQGNVTHILCGGFKSSAINANFTCLTETVTISSDEDEGGEHHHSKKKTQQQMSAPATPVSKGNKSPSHADQADCPESPIIPDIPLSTKDKRAGRRDKMEDEVSLLVDTKIYK